MGCGSNTTTSVQQPNPTFQAAYTNLLSQANSVASQPLQQYSGNIVAPLNSDQTSAINTINNSQGIANPYINQANTDLTAATQPLWNNVSQFSPSAVQQYESPYTQQVVGATQAAFNNQNAQQFNQARGSSAAAGAFGGDREAVLESQLAGQQQASEAPVIANLENQGYTTALGEFNTQQQNQLSANEANAWLNSQAGFGEMNLGTEAQNSALSGAAAQLQGGTLEQQQAQENLNVPYEQFLQQQAYPFQTTSWLEGLTEGVGSEAGGTSSTTTPAPSLLSQLGGIGLAAASLFERGGAVKNNVIPFRKRASGGMLPYNEIALSNAVPDVNVSYIPSISGGAASGNTIPRAPAGAVEENPLSTGQGLGQLSAGMDRLFNPPESYSELSNYADSNSALPAGLGFVDIGTPSLAGIKRGGPIKRRADGGPNDDPSEEDVGLPGPTSAIGMVPSPPQNNGFVSTQGQQNPFGITRPTPITVNPDKPDWHQALLAAGLAIAGGRSPNALQNIAQGAQSGLQSWNSQKKQNQDFADKQATVGMENQRSQMSYDEAVNRAHQLADDMDFRKTNMTREQQNTDRQYQHQNQVDAENRLYQANELKLRSAEVANSQAGTWSYAGVDPATQNPILINSRTGQTKTGDTAIGAKPAAASSGGGGGRYAGQVTRSLTDAKDVATDLANVIQLPVDSNTGFFGNRGSHGDGSLMGSTMDSLANAVTPQRVQDYNAHMVGLGRAMAGLETGGMAVQKALMDQFDKLAVQPGDTNLTAMRKMALMRQQAVNAAESNMASPYVGPDQKKQFGDVINGIKKAIPWTPSDVTGYEVAQKQNPDLTFKDYSKQHGIGQGGGPQYQEGQILHQNGNIFKVINGTPVPQPMAQGATP